MFATLLDALAPRRCAGCGALGDELCSGCLAQIDHSQGAFVRLAGIVESLSAAGRYEGALRRSILALKYGNRRSLAAPLAKALAKHLAVRSDLIVPVPLHPARARVRGYNQAELVAREIARCLESVAPRVAAQALQRVRATLVQSTLDAAAREHNVADAFAPGLEAREVRGARVLLVDDVVTTGATLRACAAALKQAGAQGIDAACIALRM